MLELLKTKPADPAAMSLGAVQASA